MNGLAPMHLDNILQTYTNTRSRYNFRNTDMHLIYTRTEAFRLSFFPCSFRLWNELDESAKSANTLASFKSQLFKNKTKKNDYHEYGCRKMNTILASIRMHCSKLNDDLSSNNITDINTCRLRTPISTKQAQLSNLKIVRQQLTTGDYYASRR